MNIFSILYLEYPQKVHKQQYNIKIFINKLIARLFSRYQNHTFNGITSFSQKSFFITLLKNKTKRKRF